MSILKSHIKIIVCLLLVFLAFEDVSAQDMRPVKSLDGRWRFSIGDNMEWAKPDFDDENWETIYVPGNWENQGFHGYDGYAWYRTKIILPEKPSQSNLYLMLGYIDDVDEVFVNGKKIGQSGLFPPHYSTAYTAKRKYLIPKDVINGYKLTIAVRVYDQVGEGGIVGGDISIMMDPNAIIPDLDLSGTWKFITGSCYDIKNVNFSHWNDIIVPGFWEDQGYKDYDGYACYAKEFDLRSQFIGKHMILLLGRIDDLDMVYLNGQLIGQSGIFKPETVMQRGETYRQFRSYHIPPGLLNENGKNIIVVKVFDNFGNGGIYVGPVGLINQENYIQYWRNKRNH